MRTRIFMAIAILSIVSTVSSFAQRFSFGPTIGLNSTSITRTTYARSLSRGNIGVAALYPLNDIMTIQAGLVYSMQGSGFTNTDDKILLNYLKVPIILKSKIRGGFSFNIGISPNLLFSASKYSTVDDFPVREKITKHINGFDFSIPVGVSYSLDALNLDFAIRYDISTINVNKDHLDRAKNNVWSLNVMYIIK